MTPRYYDPIKEEIEKRTERIKKELQGDGKLLAEGNDSDDKDSSNGSSIRGAFTKGSPIRKKPSTILDRAGMLRFIIMITLIGGLVGYAHWGPEVLQYIFYLGLGIVLLIFLFRLKSIGNK